MFLCDHDKQVQHLIEECIVFNMSKEECMEALETHANIKPVITSTGMLQFIFNTAEGNIIDIHDHFYTRKREKLERAREVAYHACTIYR